MRSSFEQTRRSNERGAIRSVCAPRKNTGFAELNRNPAPAPQIGSFTNGRYGWNTLNKSSSKQKPDGLVAGGVRAHVAPGVDRGVVHADFVMHVGAGGAAADAGVADDLSALDAGARNGGHSYSRARSHDSSGQSARGNGGGGGGGEIDARDASTPSVAHQASTPQR